MPHSHAAPWYSVIAQIMEWARFEPMTSTAWNTFVCGLLWAESYYEGLRVGITALGGGQIGAAYGLHRCASLRKAWSDRKLLLLMAQKMARPTGRRAKT